MARPAGDVEATRNLVQAAARAGAPQLLYAGGLLPPPDHHVGRRTWAEFLDASVVAQATGATPSD